ncbi:MAG: hypothetical protein IT379_07500, partial [Deltaproteobacteria bacterium]|nr:hypothetical protein [Deltaproteobacteria bacterium]
MANRIVSSLALLVALAGCGTDEEGDLETQDVRPAGEDPADDPTANPSEDGLGSRRPTTFEEPALMGHPVDTESVRDAVRRLAEEGPSAYTAHVHSCRKMRYGTMGRLLASRGVDLGAEGDTTAGRMWSVSDQALGAPNYEGRVPETTDMTVASAARLLDIFVQAAPEIIASMPEREECQIGGAGARIFDDEGRCQRDGVTCLLGVPASDLHLSICNETVSRASTPEIGQVIAVAALLAAQHTCE